jgi:flagellar biosynthesis protein FlhF
MQVKKYEAKSMQEAIKKIKLELGPEAVILQAKKKKNIIGLGDSGVEITAAVGKNSLLKKKYAESRMPSDLAEKLKNSPASVQKQTFDNYAKKVKGSNTVKDVANPLRRPMIKTRYVDIMDDDTVLEDGTVLQSEAGKTKAAKISISPQAAQARTKTVDQSRKINSTAPKQVFIKEPLPEHKDEEKSFSDDRARVDVSTFSKRIFILERLLFEGIDRFYADQILSAFEQIADGDLDLVDDELLDRILVRIISSQIKTCGDLRNLSGESPSVFAFVGPGGVGKTTTLAKIAARYSIDQDLKVGIICTDNERVASLEQLKVYCKIMDLPLRTASNSSELIASLRDLSDCDVVLIDTPSISFKDGEKLSKLNEMLSVDYPVVTNLLLSSVTRGTEINQTLDSFSVIPYSSLIFTRIDEAANYGCILNAAIKTRKPVSFLCNGQKVPEDIMETSSEDLAAMIIKRQ